MTTVLRYAAFVVTFCAAGAARGDGRSANVATLIERHTTEMLDAIGAGDRGPWNRYVHDALVYATEDGIVKTKAQLLDDIRPLPKNVWGTLRVTSFRVSRVANTAIANYIIEEDEGYFGQVIHARYMNTDTWIETRAGWRLVASQVLALRADPPEITLSPSELDEFTGTYRLSDEVSYTIRRDGDGLVGVREGRKPERIKVELKDCFFVPGQPRLRKIFRRDHTGRIDGFVERRESWDIVWSRDK